MNKILTSVALTLFGALFLNAQNYLAYNVQGNVIARNGAKATAVAPGSKLSPESVVTVPSGSRLTLINEKDKVMCTIKMPGSGTISTLITKEGNAILDITSNYIAFVKNKIKAGDKARDINYMQAAGTSYRGVGKLTALPEAAPGMLLEPLRKAVSDARRAFDANDADALLAAADRLEDLSIVRYQFKSDYSPRSFKGNMVLDPLCLRDLAASLDQSRPYASQIAGQTVPMPLKFDATGARGNILCNHYVLKPGESINVSVNCSGYREVVICGDVTVDGAGQKRTRDVRDGIITEYFTCTVPSMVQWKLTNDGKERKYVAFLINN